VEWVGFIEKSLCVGDNPDDYDNGDDRIGIFITRAI